MTTLYFLCAGCVLLGIATAIFDWFGRLPLKIMAKTLASVCFCVAAVISARLTTFVGDYSFMVIIALIFGLLGDVFLALGPFSKDKQTKSLFESTGVLWFAAGHIFLIIAFGEIAPFVPWTLALIVVLPILFFVFLRLGFVSAGKLSYGLLVYAAFLNLMVIFTLNIYLYRGDMISKLLVLAGVLFTVSDCCVALNTFGTDKLARARRFLPFPVMLLYYSAQAVFAMSAALL